MGKEQQLLEAAAAGNITKVENLLRGQSRLQRLLSRELIETSEEGPGGQKEVPMLVQRKPPPLHVDINTTNEDGATPLILATLNGHRDVVYNLLQYSANLLAADKKGNTALHMAAWRNRSDIVEMLIVNGARVNIANREGNTPLHFACQYCPPGKTLLLIKLLQQNAPVLAKNSSGDTPFDLAVRFNKKEAVSLLVDAEPNTLKETKSIIEAAKNGRKEIVEILLEAGMDPNCFDGASGSCPLHEAVRFFRKEVARLLLEFGARADQQSANQETPMMIIMQHPDAKKEEFLKIVRENEGKTPRIPRAFLERQQSKETKTQDTFITYPLITNKPGWTKADPDHCSGWTKQHPNTCLLDNDSYTYWKIPDSGAYNWVAFDLGAKYTLTGVRVSGWDNKQMIHNFIIETADSIKGPWTHIQKYTADSIGPETMDLPAETQDFKGFYASSRFWRLVVADNYGDLTTCLSEVQFFGVEDGVVEWFERLEMKQYLKPLIQRGFNQMSELAVLKESDLIDIIQVTDERRQFLHAAKLLRERYNPPSDLRWAIPPPVKVIAGKMVPEISIFSDAYTVGEVVLKICEEGGKVKLKIAAPLISKENGYLSRAVFKRINLEPPGEYTVEAYSLSDPSTCIPPQAITVAPAAMQQAELGAVFKDFEDMLKFDI